MVPFAGYSMPVQYADLSVGESHRWTREKASIFDVGHMVQHRLSGPGAAGILEKVTPASIGSLGVHHSTLACLLHPATGGIVDDTVITRLGPQLFYMVTNAACRQKDTAYLTENIKQYKSNSGEKIDWEILDGWGLIALQGPLSASILQHILALPEDADLSKMYFGQSKFIRTRLLSERGKGEEEEGISDPILVSRAGYTGEDGFEISVPPARTAALVNTLLQHAGPDKLRLAGLGARDSLRLEAGMCLYGHDLDDTTTPIEAGLAWTVGKDRRIGGGFHGDETILRQIKPVKEGGSGVSRRRVGFIVDGAPAREGAEILDGKGEGIGKITSGCPSPTLGKNIAMGYVRSGFHKAGTEVEIVVRGKRRKAVVTKMPFVPSKYVKGTAPA
ncbi:MAG: Aminomethyltransferase, mitochondrial [Candelina mexicana]|nr:MAG: Aminomethyltransferase, mitochondrial [Candelina mexicana]